MKDEALRMALEVLESFVKDDLCPEHYIKTIIAIKQALAQPAPVQEPVSMRMPKVGDRVVCIEDESLGTVVYLTAGGSPEIKFDDGSHGTYMLREFAELFGYTTPPAAQRTWVGLTDEEIQVVLDDPQKYYDTMNDFARAIEAKLKGKNGV